MGRERQGEKKEVKEGKKEKERKGKFFNVLEVAVHSDFSCIFCILSWWNTQTYSNSSSEGFDTGLSTF